MAASKAATITRTYPVRVMDMDGKPVKVGQLVALPVKKVEEHELRFGLKVKDRKTSNSTSQNSVEGSNA